MIVGGLQGDRFELSAANLRRFNALSTHSDEADSLVLRRVGGDSLSWLKAAGSSEVVGVEAEAFDGSIVLKVYQLD